MRRAEEHFYESLAVGAYIEGRDAMTNGTGKKEGIFRRASKFLREVWLELKKTTWPSYDELKKSTAVVLAVVAIITIWVGGLDYLLGLITRKLGW